MAALQDQLVIQSMRLRNRVALPPLTTNYGGPDGTVTDRVLRFYGERSNHVGLVIVEATAVRSDGRLVPGSLGLWEDAQVEGMARLADTIRKKGAVPVVQLNHAGAKCVPSGGKLQGASPSGLGLRPDVEAFAMSSEQIEEMAFDFAAAAGRAVAAGFEGVEIHGAHFYLISQFLSPLTNTRTDRYGGDARGRATFALDVLKATRQKVGPKTSILFRINSEERVEGGQGLEDGATVARLLAENGVDGLHVSLVSGASWLEKEGKRLLFAVSALPKNAPAGSNVPPAARIKKETGLPVIGVGKLGEGNAAAVAVANGDIDIAAIGRQMIADPDAAGKILAGKSGDVIPCKQCMGCFASLGRTGPLSCKVNEKVASYTKRTK